MSRIIAAIAGLVVGWLAATQVPLWPTPNGGIFEDWVGTYRADASGKLKRDRSDLYCPGEIETVKLVGVQYNANMYLACNYSMPDGSLDVHITLGTPFGNPAEERPIVAKLARGEMPAVRITDISAGHSTVLQQDIVVVRGKVVEVAVGCHETRGELDQKACHAIQESFLAGIDPLSLSF